MEVSALEKYIAFLRGVNVSGKNKVSMTILKEVFEDNGFYEVTTYINSGNVLFSSNVQDIMELKKKSETIIADTFQLDIPVHVVTVRELRDTLKYAPEWWGDTNKEIIHYAIFLIPPISIEEVFNAVGGIKIEYEKISHYGNVIFWSAPRITFNKAKWSKIASSSVNNNVTIRNANTVNKMIQLAE